MYDACKAKFTQEKSMSAKEPTIIDRMILPGEIFEKTPSFLKPTYRKAYRRQPAMAAFIVLEQGAAEIT